MNVTVAYAITAAFVGLVSYVILSRHHAQRWGYPLYARVALAWFFGFFWPLLSLWAIWYFGSMAAWACWRWALGEHNKPGSRIDMRI